MSSVDAESHAAVRIFSIYTVKLNFCVSVEVENDPVGRESTEPE
jgi:hypothetical protein